jgi:hypothetical protein
MKKKKRKKKEKKERKGNVARLLSIHEMNGHENQNWKYS